MTRTKMGTERGELHVRLDSIDRLGGFRQLRKPAFEECIRRAEQ